MMPDSQSGLPPPMEVGPRINEQIPGFPQPQALPASNIDPSSQGPPLPQPPLPQPGQPQPVLPSQPSPTPQTTQGIPYQPQEAAPQQSLQHPPQGPSTSNQQNAYYINLPEPKPPVNDFGQRDGTIVMEDDGTTVFTKTINKEGEFYQKKIYANQSVLVEIMVYPEFQGSFFGVPKSPQDYF